MTPVTDTPARPPWTVRVATWSARHRWPVFALWMVLTIGLFVASIALGGTRTADAVDDDREEQTTFEAARAYDVFGASGPAEDDRSPDAARRGRSRTGRSTTRRSTTSWPGSRSPPPRTAAASSRTRSTRGSPRPRPASCRPTAPPSASPPRSPARAPRSTPAWPRCAPFLEELRAAHPDLRIHSLDGTLANEDIQELVNGGLDDSLRLTIPLTFLILLVAFGAVVAAVVPLVLAITALLAAFGVLGLYSQAVAPVSPYASQLVVLIGLAVAVDYSLFMITRYRTERRHGRVKHDAIRVASATAGRAVFFSGLAVVFSIGGLFLLDDVLFHSMADRHDLGRRDRRHRLADVPAGGAGDPRRRRGPVAPAVPRPRPAGGERPVGGDGPRGHAPAGHRVRRAPRPSCS